MWECNQFRRDSRYFQKTDADSNMGGVAREQKMLKRHLPTVISPRSIRRSTSFEKEMYYERLRRAHLVLLDRLDISISLAPIDQIAASMYGKCSAGPSIRTIVTDAVLQ